MTVDERIERLTERVEALVMTAELRQKELQTLGSYIQATKGINQASTAR
jgi:archaellum component FlaC